MKLDLYIDKDGQKLRCGYTTGSCAAAAAKAAAIILKEGSFNSLKKETKEGIIYSVKIDTPAGYVLDLPVEKLQLSTLSENSAAAEKFQFTSSCKEPFAIAAVQKDAGDDPDSTDGIFIYAMVSARNDGIVNIAGGEGIGIITKKGLFGEVGDAAINPVPRKMIKDEVLKVLKTGCDVLIFSPEGKEIAKKTFNKNIGVEGGISIIGTKGIVYPMSEEAIKKTIYMEINGIAENRGTSDILLVPGNYGEKLAEELNLKIPVVKISNYAGDGLTYAYSKGFKNITLLGHIGKFAKLAIGIFNTHNRTADTRMEAFVYYLALRGVPLEVLKTVNSFLTAEECFNYLVEQNLQSVITEMERGAEERIKKYLKDEEVKIKVMIYSMKHSVCS
ncbi:cobalt-precorrin-5B (C(1))-methyltransferase CbiD [Treponema pedis]|uniref:Cobalt-precorrin-5B C(1)-methyltransferase n=1 Tax=Treponema pedis TaxID=409322 RepID=A0A7S6WR26_9SPIR|nr:cobalt-precorrin-5B (C(1))-methyltransferase CbiD [Treponema pedis]QOW61798.1 cobalamin biosynthesis protein CbiD [Treponema pedis]